MIKPMIALAFTTLSVAFALPRVGEHDASYRVVFDLKTDGSQQVTQIPGGLQIKFAAPVFSVEQGVLAVPFVQGYQTTEDTLTLNFASDYQLTPQVTYLPATGNQGARLVVDLPKPAGADAGGAAVSTTKATVAGSFVNPNREKLYPQSLNPDIDVQNYQLDLKVNPEGNQLSGVATVTLKTTASTSFVSLSLSGLKVSGVSVGADSAPFQQTSQNLRVSLGKTVPKGSSLTLTIRYAGVPKPVLEPGESYLSGIGWKQYKKGIFVLNEPNAAMTWYPVNDHPSDKATYQVNLTVPAQYQGIFNGTLLSKQNQGGETTYRYSSKEPMASYLTTVHVNKYRLESYTLPNGVLIHNYVPSSMPADFQKKELAEIPKMMQFMEKYIGPYPFKEFGVIFTEYATPYALETQTLVTFPNEVRKNHLFFHEFSHQWFGNSVTPRTWSDIWLSEGLATYFEGLWQNPTEASLKAFVRQRYERAKSRKFTSPIVKSRSNLFALGMYQRGSLVFFALRYKLGDATLQKVLKQYYNTYKYGNVDTEEFIQSVVTTTGRSDLRAYLEKWIYQDAIPDFPEIYK